MTVTNTEIQREAQFNNWTTYAFVAILIFLPTVSVVFGGLNPTTYFVVFVNIGILVVLIGYIWIPDNKAQGPVSVRLFPTKFDRLAGSVVLSTLTFGEGNTIRIYLVDDHEMLGGEDVTQVEALRIDDIAIGDVTGFTVYDELNQVHILEEMGWPREGVDTLMTQMKEIVRKHSMIVMVANRNSIPGEALDPQQYK